jgi:ABC-type multidrug transport system fused ATPase/permease subunit
VPVILLEFLQWYDDNDTEQKWKGWLFAGLLFLANFLRTILNNQGQQEFRNVALNYAICLKGLVFDAVKSTPAGAREFVDVGKISNFCTSDIKKIEMLGLFLHQVIFTPILICVYSGILIGQISWVGALVPAVLIIVLVVNVSISLKTVTLMRQKLGAADKRTKKVNEAIVGVKVIKFNAWELIIEKIIIAFRKIEKSIIIS